MRVQTFTLLFALLTMCSGADIQRWEEATGDYTAISKRDERVVMEAELQIESQDLVPSRVDRFYFIPTNQATTEEKRLNRSWVPDMKSHEARKVNWAYDAVMVASRNDVLVSIEAEKFEKGETIERAAFFRIPFLKNIDADVAGFTLKIEWKKPNQPPEPMPLKRHGSP